MTQNDNLAKREIQMKKIEELIQYNQMLILEKKRELEERKKENHFLEEVYNDYRKYYEDIVKEKKQQVQSLDNLHTYLDQLIKTKKMTEDEIQDAKKEQSIILSELNKIKKELDIL